MIEHPAVLYERTWSESRTHSGGRRIVWVQDLTRVSLIVWVQWTSASTEKRRLWKTDCETFDEKKRGHMEPLSFWMHCWTH